MAHLLADDHVDAILVERSGHDLAEAHVEYNRILLHRDRLAQELHQVDALLERTSGIGINGEDVPSGVDLLGALGVLIIAQCVTMRKRIVPTVCF